jgi:hypothetical protein
MSFSLLFDHVQERLDAWGLGASVAFGQGELARQIAQGTGRANRVVFAPGDEGRSLGAYGPANKMGPRAPGPETSYPPRSLWTWKVAGRVLIWAYDGDAPTNERRQWDALVELHDHVATAMHSFAAGSIELRAPRDPSPVVERRFGQAAMLIVELAQHVVDVRQVERTGPLKGRGTTALVGPDSQEEEQGASP